MEDFGKQSVMATENGLYLGALTHLPDEVTLMVLSHLTPSELLLVVSLVSRLFRNLARDDLLWKKFCVARWGEHVHREGCKRSQDYTSRSCRRKLNWRAVFRRRSLIERNWMKGLCRITTIAYSSEITCIQTDETRIANGSYDKTVKIWDLGQVQRLGDGEAAAVATTDGGAMSDDEEADTETRDHNSSSSRKHVPYRSLEGHRHRVYCLQFKDNFLASGSDDCTVKLWDIDAASCSATLKGHTRAVRCLQFRDNTLVSGSYDKTIKLWDLDRATNVSSLCGEQWCICCLKFDDRLIASGSYKRIKLWDPRTGKCINDLQGHGSWVTSLQFDSEKLISGSMDTTIKMWDLRNTDKCVRLLKGHEKRVRCIQYDNTKICSGSYDFTLKVWDINTGECMSTLRGHNASARCLHFTDSHLVSGSLDKSIKIWDFSYHVPF